VLRLRRLWSRWKYVGIIVAVCTLGIALLYRPYIVPSASMENTLSPGDHIFVRRYFSRSFQPGEVVAYSPPRNPDAVFIGRIVGLPGDHIRIIGKRLYRNGVEQNEPYAVHKSTDTIDFRDNFPGPPPLNLPDSDWLDLLRRKKAGDDLWIPPERYFLLGDNRDDALDSRYIGFLEPGNIVGIPLLGLRF